MANKRNPAPGPSSKIVATNNAEVSGISVGSGSSQIEADNAKVSDVGVGQARKKRPAPTPGAWTLKVIVPIVLAVIAAVAAIVAAVLGRKP